MPPPVCRRRRGVVIEKVVIALVLLVTCVVAPLQVAGEDVSGTLVIAGNGPEMPMIERLARAFEKANPRAYVDVVWDDNSKPVEMVKAGQAHLAVTGKEEQALNATQIGWDGIAVMVHASNTTKELTSQQVADLFSGKIKFWSDLGGPDDRVLLIDRPSNMNIRDYFLRQLNINGTFPESAKVKVIKPDDRAIGAVSGTLPPYSAVTYISLGAALHAVFTGATVRLLPIDKVEPEEPTVKDGRYKLRRPMLLLSKKESNPTVDAFLAFALSNAGQTIIDNEAYTPLDQKN